MALSPWVKPITYCENDRWAQALLLSRMRKLELPSAPIWDDITTLLPEVLPGGASIDIIYGGFPCQDISSAGSGAGLEGKRSGLFFEIVRLSRELRPQFIFLENVPAISVRGLDRVLLEFTALGYDCRWTTISAAEMGAPHLRERWFLLAYSSGVRRNPHGPRKPQSCSETLVNPHSSGCPVPQESNARGRIDSQGERIDPAATGAGWWNSEPDVGRVADGISPELDFFINGNEELDVSYFEGNDSKALAAANLFNREVLRKMWEFRELAEASPELYFGKLHDSLPGLPQKPTYFRANLGQRIQEGSELYDLWKSFYSASEQTEQALWQSKLLERIGTIRREETMAKSNRVNRLTGLGNAVVPAQAREAFMRLMGINEIARRANG